MAIGHWIIERSAFVGLPTALDRDVWSNRIELGLVSLSVVTRLEIGFSARNSADLWSSLKVPPLSFMPLEHFTPAAENRAAEVQLRLAERGQHRIPSIPNLLIAATAEVKELTVLYLDTDFDLIAEITGQHLERLQTP